MNVKATAKYVRTSPRKVGLVAAMIRGRKAQEAMVVLANAQKGAADPVGKVLKSAIANAENNHKMSAADLQIESVFVGPGPTLKRFRPAARGRAQAIRKRSSHITVVLTDGKAASANQSRLRDSTKASGSPRSKTDSTDSAQQPTKKEAK